MSIKARIDKLEQLVTDRFPDPAPLDPALEAILAATYGDDDQSQAVDVGPTLEAVPLLSGPDLARFHRDLESIYGDPPPIRIILP